METEKTETEVYEEIQNHPMFSKSDLDYFLAKGYRMEDVLKFWDRDHKAGKKPVIWN